MKSEAEDREPSLGCWRFGNSDSTEATSLAVAGGQAAVFTSPYPGGENTNEDAAVVIAREDGSAVLAVADGFGGAPAGERASKIAITELVKSVNREPDNSLRAAILDGFESANRSILDLALGAATTLVVAGIEDGVVRAYYSGDSAMLVVGGRGKVKWETVAHSPVGYAVASGWIDETEARGHEEAQVVSNYLGSSEMRIEIGPTLKLAPRDTVLLASDGLTDNLSQERVKRSLVRRTPLAESLDELASKTHVRMTEPAGKPDDLTLIAFRPNRSARRGQAPYSQPRTTHAQNRPGSSE